MFSQETTDFLSDLRANNTRDWFEENRSTYYAAVRDPSKVFAGALSHLLEERGQGEVSPKIFRIIRAAICCGARGRWSGRTPMTRNWSWGQRAPRAALTG